MKGRYVALIPAFNAAETIGDVIRGIRQLGLPVVVVDDGSRDTTAAVAAEQGAVVISHLRNEGKGAALRTGFQYALRETYDGVITVDSDGQHDPAEIPRLIEAGERQHAGLVVGNRMGNGQAMPPLRRWTNRVMSRIVSMVSRQHIPDSQCGFRLIRKELLASVPLTATRYEIETELLLAAGRKRWKTVSVPVQSIYHGRPSHIRPLQDAWRFLQLIWRYLR